VARDIRTLSSDASEASEQSGATDPATNTAASDVIEAASALQRYDGASFSFEYPADWHIWDVTTEADTEVVVLANRPPEPLGHNGLLPGTVKVDFVMTTQAGIQVETPPASATPVSFPPSDVEYFVYHDEVWVISGNHSDPNPSYVVTAMAATEEPPMEALEIILGSWVAKTE
jgi:hypothetical protein